jgi:hypothetical protein
MARRLILTVLFILSLIFTSGFSTMAQGVALGYESSDPELKPGMVVQLNGENQGSSQVERGTSETQDKIIGLATRPDEVSVVIANGGQRVYVQTSGEADAYVSDIGGNIKQGDQLTISPLKGILMKSDGSQGIVFGTALEDFSDTDAESYDINGGSSGISSAKVDKIKINLDAGSFADLQEVAPDSNLAAIGKSLTGKDVGEIRVLIALLLFLIVLVAEGGIIYAAISSSITAIGRNPLASKVIKYEFIKILVIAVAVLLIGLGAIYAVLKV